ncbi:MAG: sigma-70 family RNA polymerase sigma factor [Candidatus Doudnabacteria bacterium]|nr:sigma-70 family RNA polymerase sigma factor [Candidatus Doudnabacteria bacterium]
MTDEELKKALESAQSGNTSAFGIIYDNYSEKMFRFIFFRVGHKEVAEDILADTFVKAWQKINQVQSHSAIPSWLYQIAKNNIIDFYRVRKTTISLEEVASVLEDAATPIDELSLGFEQRKILKMLEQLPLEQQQVIQYKFFEDLTNQEIALIMNKTEGAVRVLQHRAIIKLKELLKRGPTS